jgi:hypothetical protein
MDSTGALSVKPVRQSRAVAILAGIWLAIILVLGAWWASIVLNQSRRIAELSLAAGLPQAETLEELAKIQRMLLWESGTFLVLLLTLSTALFWYYRRDMQAPPGGLAELARDQWQQLTRADSLRKLVQRGRTEIAKSFGDPDNVGNGLA